MSDFLDSMWRGWAPAFLLVLAVAGCASVPQASPERDAAAKQFRTQPGAATIYVYRPDFGTSGGVDTTVLRVDGRLIGDTLPRTYFRLDLRPGRHLMSVDAPDNASLVIDTSPGELYFVALTMTGGSSQFSQTTPAEGRRAIQACCALMENWAPGQRPLLR